jgi:hypothetical protein
VALAQVARMRYPRHAEPRFVDIHSSVTRKLWWRRLLGDPAFVAPAHRLSTHSVRQSLAAAVHERQASVWRVILRTIAWDVALCLLAYRFFPPALAAMLIIPLRAAAAAFSWPIPLRLSYPLGRRDRLRHARAVGVVNVAFAAVMVVALWLLYHIDPMAYWVPVAGKVRPLMDSSAVLLIAATAMTGLLLPVAQWLDNRLPIRGSVANVGVTLMASTLPMVFLILLPAQGAMAALQQNVGSVAALFVLATVLGQLALAIAIRRRYLGKDLVAA